MYIHQPKQCQQNLPVESENRYFCENQDLVTNYKLCPEFRKGFKILHVKRSELFSSYNFKILVCQTSQSI